MEKGRSSRNNTKVAKPRGQKKDHEMTKIRNIAFHEILEEDFSTEKDSGQSGKNKNREKGDITLSEKELMDISLKLVLVDLEAGAERHSTDARCSGSESQMTDLSLERRKN